MKKLDRFSLIDRIGRELQSRMSYSDIDVYLPGFGVDVSKPTSGVNSKWVYTKELLADAPDATILAIADELEIPHDFVAAADSSMIDASFWEPHHLRLFLSHLSQIKKAAASLQHALRRYGVSAFVAHVDIEPTKQWQGEIEAGLCSMDALAAIVMPGFKESNWTDQEVGAAVGRGVLIIPLIYGLDPYGFIGKYQGLHVTGKKPSEIAEGVFRTLVSAPKTRGRMLTALVDTTLLVSSPAEALDRLQIIESVADLPDAHLERLREGASSSLMWSAGEPLDRLNALLDSRGLGLVELGQPTGLDALGEELPF